MLALQTTVGARERVAGESGSPRANRAQDDGREVGRKRASAVKVGYIPLHELEVALASFCGRGPLCDRDRVQRRGAGHEHPRRGVLRRDVLRPRQVLRRLRAGPRQRMQRAREHPHERGAPARHRLFPLRGVRERVPLEDARRFAADRRAEQDSRRLLQYMCKRPGDLRGGLLRRPPPGHPRGRRRPAARVLGRSDERGRRRVCVPGGLPARVLDLRPRRHEEEDVCPEGERGGVPRPWAAQRRGRAARS